MNTLFKKHCESTVNTLFKKHCEHVVQKALAKTVVVEKTHAERKRQKPARAVTGSDIDIEFPPNPDWREVKTCSFGGSIDLSLPPSSPPTPPPTHPHPSSSHLSPHHGCSRAVAVVCL